MLAGVRVQLRRACLLVFIADFLLHLWVTPRPLAYLRSFYGLIDLSAVLFFFVPQISSGLILWIFKFGRVLRVFKLLRFLDEAQLLGNALRASARRTGHRHRAAHCDQWGRCCRVSQGSDPVIQAIASRRYPDSLP
jgi:hypothetical protein